MEDKQTVPKKKHRSTTLLHTAHHHWQRAALSNQIHEVTSAPTVNRQLLHRCVRMLSNWNLQRWQNFLSPIKTETWLTVWFNVSVIVQPSRQITMLPLYVSADKFCTSHHYFYNTCWGGGCCCRVTPVPAGCRVRDHFNQPTAHVSDRWLILQPSCGTKSGLETFSGWKIFHSC